MTSGKYILVDRVPVIEGDLLTWAEWLETADLTVATTEVGSRLVMTVFLGVDFSFAEGPPLLFETVVRNADGQVESQCRCSTWSEAEAQHAEEVEALRNA
jgi:hypothetical protein